MRYAVIYGRAVISTTASVQGIHKVYCALRCSSLALFVICIICICKRYSRSVSQMSHRSVRHYTRSELISATEFTSSEASEAKFETWRCDPTYVYNEVVNGKSELGLHEKN